MNGAYYTGKYRNRFAELGIPEEEIEKRKNEIFETIFHGPEDEKFYFEVGDDMAFMEDTGNIDARTEGMSYGMMMCVQMNKQDEFNRLWKWAKTYMYLTEGSEAGYFAWSVSPEGKKNANGAAPDGEEFFITALFMASNRWGDGEGIFNYRAEAEKLLDDCINKGNRGEGRSMWDPDNKLIRFVAGVDFTDPSYHLPHFYTYIADQTSNKENAAFMREAVTASREFLNIACHPVTGLNPEYSSFEGTKIITPWDGQSHGDYFSDAYRTGANIALDYSWFEADEREKEQSRKQIDFFCNTIGKDNWDGIFAVDGTVLEGKALHPVAIVATNAQAALNLEGEDAEYCIRRFWETPLRKGDRRYYDNCLYFFAFLALSGNYRAKWD